MGITHPWNFSCTKSLDCIAVNPFVFALFVFVGMPLSAFAQGGQVELINGKKLPGVIQGLTNTKTLVDRTRPDGNRILAVRGIRLPGTRVPIHVHDHSGLTCVVSGQITDFVEGENDQVFGPGECYYMPEKTPMSAANLGQDPVMLIDVFVLPPGEAPMRVVESGVSGHE